MMENLSPEIWPPVADRCREDCVEWNDAGEPEADSPKPGEILREIALIIAAHTAIGLIVLTTLKLSGIQ
jgi:hypothetical protein